MEVLAPAGNQENLERAIAAGADAVYLGYSAFSARAGAGNFTDDQIEKAIRFAHCYHVKVYVTINTLIKDSEMAEVYQLLSRLSLLGADAVLVQDLGVLALLRKCFPELPVHASTQMAIHNATGVSFCRQIGMKRAVLAREANLREIEQCCQQGLEIEVFCHGAQCVCVSGECLFSSMLGDRSGNRGRCAQPCRLQYTCHGQEGAWLSPRDLSLRDDLEALYQAGVTSVKIEGRLKSAAYVAVTTAAYHKAIQAIEHGSFEKSTTDEKEALLQVFHRGDMMRGYVFGEEDAGIIDPHHVRHTGLPIGTVIRHHTTLVEVLLQKELHDGDLLRLGVETQREMRYSGANKRAGEIAQVYLRSDLFARQGETVYRLIDVKQEAIADSIPLPKIPFTAELKAIPGLPLTLTVCDDADNMVTVTGASVAMAKSRVFTEEDAIQSVSKSGDTPFRFAGLSVQTAQAFVPVSSLNELRRNALDQLLNKRIEAATSHYSDPSSFALGTEKLLPSEGKPVFFFRNPEQYRLLQEEPGYLVWHPEDYRLSALSREITHFHQKIWFQLPIACEEQTLQLLHAWLTEHQQAFAGIVLGSVGQLGISWPLPIAAGQGIPVMNRLAAGFLFDRGCRFVIASPELTEMELRQLTDKCKAIAAPAYGRTQLMLLHHCPARTCQGKKQGHSACELCDHQSSVSLRSTIFQDRKGIAFPLLRERLPEGCLVRLMNSIPLDNRRQMQKSGMTMALEFTTENKQELQAVLQADSIQPATSGHWHRPVL